MSDLCPVPTMFKELNLIGHRTTIEYAALGPADPREPSTEFWSDKQTKWKVSEGVARTRLCMNCAHYKNDEETMACLTGPGAQLKASEVDSSWADIDGMPSAVCTRWPITCSALRTCDDWENPNEDPDNSNVEFVSPEEEPEMEMSLEKDIKRMLEECQTRIK